MACRGVTAKDICLWCLTGIAQAFLGGACGNSVTLHTRFSNWANSGVWKTP